MSDMRSYLFLAEGFEEIEAISVVDVMRRASMNVATVSITDSKIVKGAHGVPVEADLLMSECDFLDADWLVMPGGLPGAENLHNCEPLNDLIKEHFAKGGNVAAICAAPALVLAPLGVLNGKAATCYPGFESHLREGGAEYRDVRVVSSGNVVTANGPRSAARFGLAIVAHSCGEQVASQVGTGMLYYKRTVNFYF